MRNKRTPPNKTSSKGSNKSQKQGHKGKNQTSAKPSNPRDHKRQKPSKPQIKIDLYGTHAVNAAWTNPKRHIHALYITEKALDSFEEPLQKAQKMGLKRPSPQIIDKSTLDQATATGSVHQGIGLNCQNLDETDIHDFIRASQTMGETQQRSVLIMLDQVTDPHNVGAIIRSACVFGAAGMIMQKKHAPELTGVLAKTACGGVEHLPVAYETNLTRSLETLQEAGYFAVGLAEEGEDNLSDFANHDKLVLVLGAEGDGIRRLVRAQCDALTRLPTAGPISSLNVSNAAAVALYAVK